MKRLLLAFYLFGPALAMGQTNAVRLSDAVKDFPRSELHPTSAGPVSIEANQDARTAFAAVAAAAGLNLIVDRDFRSSPVRTRIENASVLEALDLLAKQTGSFIEVLDEKTLIVAMDVAVKRREYELQVIKTFPLTNTTTDQGRSQIVTALRSTLNVRYIMSSSATNSIVIRDTPDRIAIAEKTISELDKTAAGAARPAGMATNAAGNLFVRDNARVQRLSPGRSGLQVGNNLQSFQLDMDSRSAFEALAKAAGLQVIFDRDFRGLPVQFKANNVSVLDALDDMALQTGCFWTVLDANTISIAANNLAKRRNFDPHILKTFYFPNASPLELNEIATAIRTLLNVRYLTVVASRQAIVMRDTPNQMKLAEKIVADLSRVSAFNSGSDFPIGTESGLVLSRRATRGIDPAQAQLQLKSGGVSLDLNQTARRSYEEIARLAGIRVIFDRRFIDGPLTSFRLDNVDPADALDYLSLQSGNVWVPMDSSTIVVAPDSPTIRAELESSVAKTIELGAADPTAISEFVTALKTILNLRNIGEGPHSIVVRDSPANIALAERILQDLSRTGK